LAEVDEPPSLKLQEYETIVPSESDEPALENCTVNGAEPFVGVALAAAVGG
jgi:hypothetical protein